MSDDEHITTGQAAVLLQVHPNTIRNWVHAGYLTDTRVPGTPQIRLSRTEVERRMHADRAGDGREATFRRVEAMTRLLLNDGHITPMGVRQILQVLRAELGMSFEA